MRKVRLREVPIILRFFFCSHQFDLLGRLIPEQGRLLDLAARLEHGDLPVYLNFERPLDRLERVHILDLCSHAEPAFAGLFHGDVRITSEFSLLHVSTGDFEILQ